MINDHDQLRIKRLMTYFEASKEPLHREILRLEDELRTGAIWNLHHALLLWEAFSSWNWGSCCQGAWCFTYMPGLQSDSFLRDIEEDYAGLWIRASDATPSLKSTLFNETEYAYIDRIWLDVSQDNLLEPKKRMRCRVSDCELTT